MSIESYLTDMEDRAHKEYPEGYALTYKESKQLETIYSFIFPIMDRCITRMKNGESQYLVTPDVASEVAAIMKRRRYSLQSKYELFCKITSKGWWAIYSTADYVPVGYKLGLGVMYHKPHTRMKDNWEESTILYERCPTAYDDGIEGRDKKPIAEALGIDPSAGYMGGLELRVLPFLAAAYSRLYFTDGTASPAISPEGFTAIPASPITLALATTRGKNIKEKDLYTGEVTAVSTYGKTVKVHLSNPQAVMVSLDSPNVDKLWKQIIHTAITTANSDKTVCITVDDFMKFRGLSDSKEARKSFRKALDELVDIKISADYGRLSFSKYTLVQEAHYVDGKSLGMIVLSDRIAEHIEQIQSQIALYPDTLLAIPNNKPNTYWIGSAFAQQKRNNVGKSGNIENKLKVATLLGYTSLPDISSVASGQTKKRISKPFDDCMRYLRDEAKMFTSYRYLRDGVEVSNIENYLTDYNTFSSLVVEVIWATEPAYEHLKERREIQKAKSDTSKKRGRPKKSL